MPCPAPVADADGNLFATTEGTTAQLASNYDGTVFEVAKTATGYSSSTTVLVSFQDQYAGVTPAGDLIVDANGDLFGTNYLGGPIVNAGTGVRDR